MGGIITGPLAAPAPKNLIYPIEKPSPAACLQVFKKPDRHDARLPRQRKIARTQAKKKPEARLGSGFYCAAFTARLSQA
jgi:hypothetical protein